MRAAAEFPHSSFRPRLPVIELPKFQQTMGQRSGDHRRIERVDGEISLDQMLDTEEPGLRDCLGRPRTRPARRCCTIRRNGTCRLSRGTDLRGAAPRVGAADHRASSDRLASRRHGHSASRRAMVLEAAPQRNVRQSVSTELARAKLFASEIGE
jgi:hypothetical protein